MKLVGTARCRPPTAGRRRAEGAPDPVSVPRTQPCFPPCHMSHSAPADCVLVPDRSVFAGTRRRSWRSGASGAASQSGRARRSRVCRRRRSWSRSACGSTDGHAAPSNSCRALELMPCPCPVPLSLRSRAGCSRGRFNTHPSVSMHSVAVRSMPAQEALAAPRACAVHPV